MRTALMAVLALVMSIIVLASVFGATNAVWDDGEEEVEETGGFFTECINEVFTEEETECGLFGENEDDNNEG